MEGSKKSKLLEVKSDLAKATKCCQNVFFKLTIKYFKKVRMKERTALFGLGLRGLKLSIGGFNNQLLLGERGPGL
jgi:hypothetical protein